MGLAQSGCFDFHACLPNSAIFLGVLNDLFELGIGFTLASEMPILPRLLIQKATSAGYLLVV